MNILPQLAISARKFRSGNLSSIKCTKQPEKFLRLKATALDWFVVQQCCGLENDQIKKVNAEAKELSEILDRPPFTVPWKEDVYMVLTDFGLDSDELRYRLGIPVMACDLLFIESCFHGVDLGAVMEKALSIAYELNRPQNLYRTDIPVEIWKSDLVYSLNFLYPFDFSVY